MRCLWCGLVLCGLLLPGRVDAEFYRYRDESGTIRFTDNIAEVPAAQRPEVERYKEAVLPTAPAGGDTAEKVPSFEEVQAARMRLNNTKTELDSEFGELMRAKETLSQERAGVSNAEQAAAVRDKILELNKRIADYENRRHQYDTNLAEFKKSEKARMSQP